MPWENSAPAREPGVCLFSLESTLTEYERRGCRGSHTFWVCSFPFVLQLCDSHVPKREFPQFPSHSSWGLGKDGGLTEGQMGDGNSLKVGSSGRCHV